MFDDTEVDWLFVICAPDDDWAPWLEVVEFLEPPLELPTWCAVSATANVVVLPVDVLPAVSVWVAAVVCAPPLKALVEVQLHVPVPPTVVLHKTLPCSSRTVTVEPGSPWPLNVGLALVNRCPVVGLSTLGAGPGVVSIVSD